MSVKKVKISELPQLPPAASGEGIFMPAADENNRSYRVPLSRYDDAKNEAATAAAAAQGAASAAQNAAALASSAAEAANTAADKANGFTDQKLAHSGPLSAQKGIVSPPTRASRFVSGGVSNILYPIEGRGVTYDLKMPGTGDMVSLLSEVAEYGDVTVCAFGNYTSGWYRDGASSSYQAIIRAHKITADSYCFEATDLLTMKVMFLFKNADATSPWQTLPAGGTPTGTAGGSLAGSYPNPTIKSSVNLPGSPTTTTQNASDNSTKVATTAYVKNNLNDYVTTSDARLSDNRIPKGTAGGSLAGSYPNPTIKSSVNLPGSPTTTTQAAADNSTKIATTAFVRNSKEHKFTMLSGGATVDWNGDGDVFLSNLATISLKIGASLPVYAKGYVSNRCDIIADVANTGANSVKVNIILPSGKVNTTSLNITTGKNYLIHLLAVKFSSGDPSLILTLDEKF